MMRLRAATIDDIEPGLGARVPAYPARFGRWFSTELREGRLWGWIAEDPRGTAIGSGLVWLQPRFPGAHFPHQRLPYILQVYTDPAWRGRGIASSIVERIVTSARARGYPRILLHSSPAGRSLYERLGFQPTTEMRLELTRKSGVRT